MSRENTHVYGVGMNLKSHHCTKNGDFIKDFFSKPDQISKKLRMWSHLLKKSLMRNLIFLYSAWRLHCASFEWLLMVNDVIKSRWRSSVKKESKH